MNILPAKQWKRRILLLVESGAVHSSSILGVYALQYCLTQQLGRTAYGYFSYVQSIVSVAAVLVSVGLPTTLIRLLSEYLENSNLTFFKGLLIRSYQIVILNSVIVITGLAFFFYFLKNSDPTISVLFPALILIPIIATTSLRTRTLQSLGKIKLSVLPDTLCAPVTATLIIYCLDIRSPVTAMLSYIACLTITSICMHSNLILSLPVKVWGLCAEYQTVTWLKIALPVFIGSTSQILMNRAGTLTYGIADHPSEAGLFQAATYVAGINMLALNALNLYVVPKISQLSAEGNYERLRSILHQIILTATVITIPFFLICQMRPALLMGIMGEDFKSASTLLRILSIGQFANCITGPIGFTLIITGGEKEFALSACLTSLVLIPSLFLCVLFQKLFLVPVVIVLAIICLNFTQYIFVKNILSKAIKNK